MLDVVYNFENELINFIVFVQRNGIGNIFVLIEKEELFPSLKTYSLEVLFETLRLLHCLYYNYLITEAALNIIIYNDLPIYRISSGP